VLRGLLIGGCTAGLNGGIGDHGAAGILYGSGNPAQDILRADWRNAQQANSQQREMQPML
jgi:hypothetical protein